jgi:hypothetical protein
MKFTPKSCSCNACKRSKRSKQGHFYMKAAERSYRHKAKVELQNGGELSEPILKTIRMG